MSEKCDSCGRTFFITSNREQRDVDYWQEQMQGIYCDRCRKRFNQNQQAKILADSLSKTESGEKSINNDVYAA